MCWTAASRKASDQCHLSDQMSFVAVSRFVGGSPHRGLAAREKYGELACGLEDHSDVITLAIG